MRILVTGASGLIGSALLGSLRRGGHDASALVRRPASGGGEVKWNPNAVDPAPFEGADAVVHLAGANIAAGRWTPERKKVIADSRVDSTRNVAQSIAATTRKPKVLVSASAIGFYGDRGDELLHESSPGGSGFLAEVAREWEAAAQPAERAGIRVVLPRIGVVLSGRGGALPKIALPFRMFMGGRVGSGGQWMSWIELDDMVRLIVFAIENDSVRGPVNAVAPQAVTNSEFTRTLAHVLHRPAIFPAPAFAVRLAMGTEMANELLLSSSRVEPKVALNAGFRFEYPQLHSALARALNEP
ncbi:MAG: TIGR01777 family oxidoreductase [Terriglobales bacterium]